MICRHEMQSDVQVLKFLEEHLQNANASWEYKHMI